MIAMHKVEKKDISIIKGNHKSMSQVTSRIFATFLQYFWHSIVYYTVVDSLSDPPKFQFLCQFTFFLDEFDF